MMSKEEKLVVYAAVVQGVTSTLKDIGHTQPPGIKKIADTTAMMALEFIGAAEENHLLGK